MSTTPARRRLTLRRQAVVPAAVGLAVFLACLLTYQHGALNFGVYRLDLDVYRVGASAWLHGHALYGSLPPISDGLLEPFTYPPVSAVVMTPFAVVTTTAAGIMMTTLSLALLVSVLALFLRFTKLIEGPGSWRVALLFMPLAVLIEPARTTLAYGQVNVVLLALVAFDCLLPSTWFTVRGKTVGWPRGALCGVAAALKLTPMVFVLYFVARRDWRGVLSLVGGFVVTTGLGLAVAPHDSWQYFTKTVFNTSRIGDHDFSGNQSISGVLARMHLTGSTENLIWLALCAMIGLIALTAVYRTSKAGKQFTAVVLTECTALLVSPISWSHHWVWVSPVLVCALIKGWRLRKTEGWRYFGISAAVAVVFLSSPQLWFPHANDRELGWAWWEQIIGSAYVWVALVALCYYAFRPAPKDAPSSPTSARGAVAGPAVEAPLPDEGEDDSAARRPAGVVMVNGDEGVRGVNGENERERAKQRV